MFSVYIIYCIYVFGNACLIMCCFCDEHNAMNLVVIIKN